MLILLRLHFVVPLNYIRWHVPPLIENLGDMSHEIFSHNPLLAHAPSLSIAVCLLKLIQVLLIPSEPVSITMGPVPLQRGLH